MPSLRPFLQSNLDNNVLANSSSCASYYEMSAKDEQAVGYTIDALGRRKWDKEFYQRQALTQTAPLQRTEARLGLGLHCAVCGVTFRDSHAYLDHVNGKTHNRALGMNVVKSTPDEVKDKLMDIRRRLYPGEDLKYSEST